MFRFKKFSIAQDKAAMKVGTDGVLLGAWSSVSNQLNILDIGTGTGLIALMLAQRNARANIHAIEIEKNAFEQAIVNFQNSPWSDRLTIDHTSLQEFKPNHQFDLIISNPPFFTEDYHSNYHDRNIARNSISLPFEKLLLFVSLYMTKKGSFEVVIPFSEESLFRSLANQFLLFPTHITRVKGSIDTPIKRSLIRFSFEEVDCEIDELVIEKSRHVYTEAYINLTKEFYLKM